MTCTAASNPIRPQRHRQTHTPTGAGTPPGAAPPPAYGRTRATLGAGASRLGASGHGGRAHPTTTNPTRHGTGRPRARAGGPPHRGEADRGGRGGTSHQHRGVPAQQARGGRPRPPGRHTCRTAYFNQTGWTHTPTGRTDPAPRTHPRQARGLTPARTIAGWQTRRASDQPARPERPRAPPPAHTRAGWARRGRYRTSPVNPLLRPLLRGATPRPGRNEPTGLGNDTGHKGRGGTGARDNPTKIPGRRARDFASALPGGADSVPPAGGTPLATASAPERGART